MRILLVRHGETTSNLIGALDSGEPGPNLTSLGQRQSRALVKALAGLDVASLHASTLVRTQQTAAPLAAHLGMPVTIHDGLREIEAGDLEMRTDREAVRIYLDAVCPWATGDLDRRMPGGPDGHTFFARFDAAIAAVERAGDGVAVVFSHGGSIRVWAATRCENVPGTWAAESQLHNTGRVLIEGSSKDGWQLLEWHAEPAGGAQLDDHLGDPTSKPA